MDPSMPPAPPPAQVATPIAGAINLRRLTRAQYVNTVRALIGPDAQVSADVAELSTHPDNDLEYRSMAAAREGFNDAEVQALFDGALTALDSIFGDPAARSSLVGCTPASVADSCVQSFITRFGRRAFRRPLTPEEIARYLDLAQTASALDQGVWSGLEYAVAALLQSPSLLYLPETGEPDPDHASRRRYTSGEMASRIAFALTNAPPDDALLDAADQNLLVLPAEVERQAARLLATPQARDAVIDGWFAEYFNLDALAGLGKDASIYPTWSSSLAASMGEEVRRVVGLAVFDEEADFSTLFESRTTFVDAALADLYGLAAPEGTGFSRVQIPDNWDRVGLLTTGAFLAINSKSSRSSPTMRGRFIMERLLCTSVPPPPPNVPPLTNTSSTSGPETMRQRLAGHRTNPACSGCHSLMDPPGLTLEHFDGIGAFRIDDGGLALDVSGSIDGTSFDGSTGLAHTLAHDPHVPACLAVQAYRYMTGDHGDGSRVALEAIGGGQNKVRALLAAIVKSDAFRYFVPPQ
jgi:hypothetical protein